ncbi:MAG: hypothetical protein ABJG68_03450 [Crocinitomicaceae bacterium]
MKLVFIVLMLCATSMVSAQEANWTSEFQLRFSFAGLGDNSGTSATGFQLEGNHFKIVNETNQCHEGGLDPNSKTLTEGELSEETMEALMEVFNDLSDTTIYKTDLTVSSGGVHTLTMATSVKMVKFSLHNETDETARKIIAIINEGLPEGVEKLWIY